MDFVTKKQAVEYFGERVFNMLLKEYSNRNKQKALINDETLSSPLIVSDFELFLQGFVLGRRFYSNGR